MVAPQQGFAEIVNAESPQHTVAALENLKNEIIGHPERKRQAIEDGIVKVILHILRGNGGEERIQAAIILASLFQKSTDVAEVSEVIDVLLQCIATKELALSLPCLRALNILVASGASLNLTMYLPGLVEILQSALTTTKSNALQVATCVATLFHYTKVTLAEELVDVLIEITIECTQLGQRYLLSNTPTSRLLEATLRAIAALTRDDARMCTIFGAAGRTSMYCCTSDTSPMTTTLMKLIKHESNAMRLGAASCLANLFKHGVIPRAHHQEMALSLLPILIRLFDEPHMKSQASYVLTELVKDSDVMQRAACEAGAIKKVAVILQPNDCDDSTTEAALLAIAAITLQKDEYRKQVIDAKVVPLIVNAMSHPSAKVRTAACQCARSLSRSVAMLRTSLIDAGVAPAILPLLSDSHLSVKTAATAAICNLVLDFSPMRKTILDFGILSLLSKLSYEEDPELRLNAVWAIKHIVYAADSDVKESVLHELTPTTLLRLCDDPVMSIQEQACEVIRNLVCGKPENIDLLIEGIGIERLADFLVRKLTSNAPEIVVPAIYSLVHIAAGSERHRMILMQRSAILESLYKHMTNRSEEIRIGAVWTLINLTWHEDEATQQERRARIEVLASLGFLDVLNVIAEDSSLDVRERVKTALAQMQ